MAMQGQQQRVYMSIITILVLCMLAAGAAAFKAHEFKVREPE